ncbi:MAG: alanine racemase [Oscillospiraceae bacterium]|jgi:alanine racemase|nr:alanine racemase [Oscillospiraceae bacterium]
MADNLQSRHRLWVEIDLDRLRDNYHTACGALQSGRVMPVVKADAYGHGAARAALALRRGPRPPGFFAVATAEEALQLRRHGVDCGILLLGVSPEAHLPALAGAGVTLCVPDPATARIYEKTLGGRKVNVHIKFDTGMTRLGLPPATAVRDALEIANILNVTGLFTHFAAADDPSEDAFTREQFDRFDAVCGQLGGHGLTNAVRHAANSAALLAHPYTHLDYARPGLMLYGYSPSGRADTGLRPVLSLYSSVMQCHAVPPGTTVSYGRTWTAQRESIIASIPLGYADGYGHGPPRTPGPDCGGEQGQRPPCGGLYMLVRGRRAPLVGRVCMDFCMLDVTDVPGVAPGDPVTVLGDGGALSAAGIARLTGTIPWDVLCSIGRRVPRVYRQGGQITEETNDIDRL